MKLALVDDFCPALVEGKSIYKLDGILPEIMAIPESNRLAGLISKWDEFAARFTTPRGKPLDLMNVKLRAPIPRPVKLLCAQFSFREGLATTSVKPSFFLKSSSSVVGPGDIVELPDVNAQVFHHEAELAVVIGKRAKNVSMEDAMNHVFAYTCFMDLSARGIGPGTAFQDKSYDTFGPMGPWLVTADEIADPHDLRVRLWVDGEPRHDYTMNDLGTSIAALISYASSISALEPGDVLAMGVNHQGLGPIQDGETVRIEITNIGAFEVRISDPLRRRWEKGIDTSAAAAVRRLVSGEPIGSLSFSRRLDQPAA